MSLPTREHRMAQYDAVEAAQREFDSMLSRWFGGGNTGNLAAPFAVDVREDADRLWVDAELPGFTKDEVGITLENKTLTITAEKKENGTGKGDYLLQERRYARFQRSFTLPPTVDSSKVDAKLTDGVLTVTLNKREEVKPRKISVS